MPRRWREPREYRRRYPACNLCGEKICSFSTTEISEILYRNAPKDLNILSPHNPWIHGRPADLDDIHFDEMWTWSCPFRVVMFRLEKEGPRFHLSGVGELRPTHKVSLPQDEDEMILWNHRSESQHVPLIPNFVSTPAYPLGHLLGYGYHKSFPMHERCWHLMTRILDVELIKKDMDIFFRAMCEPQRVTWREVNSSHVSPVYKGWLEFISGLTPISYLIPLQFRAKDDANPSHMPRHFRSADPLNDSYMKNLIAKYTAKYTKQREKGFEPVSQYSSPTHTMSRRIQATFKPRNVLLPTELILNIADYLEHHKDIQTLLWVFPRWHSMIPDSYWRRRFIDDNYKLLRPSWGWRNRQRILSRLEETKARFLQQLEQKEIQD